MRSLIINTESFLMRACCGCEEQNTVTWARKQSTAFEETQRRALPLHCWVWKSDNVCHVKAVWEITKAGSSWARATDNNTRQTTLKYAYRGLKKAVKLLTQLKLWDNKWLWVPATYIEFIYRKLMQKMSLWNWGQPFRLFARMWNKLKKIKRSFNPPKYPQLSCEGNSIWDNIFL